MECFVESQQLHALQQVSHKYYYIIYINIIYYMYVLFLSNTFSYLHLLLPTIHTKKIPSYIHTRYLANNSGLGTEGALAQHAHTEEVKKYDSEWRYDAQIYL